MPGWLPEASLILLFVVGLMILQGYVMVTSMGRRTSRLIPLSDEDAGFSEAFRRAAQYDDWLAYQGFERIGCYRATMGPQAVVVAWRQFESPRFFCMYLHQGRSHFDLMTVFSEGTGLTTGTTKDGFLFPKRPGDYLQTFTCEDVGQLWDMHLEAEHYLVRSGGIRTEPLHTEFQELFLGELRAQMAYVRTHFLWPLRMWYWYAFRRGSRHNMTIEEQHQAGLIAVPPQVEQ